ncbi:Mitogen-activated protein kinase HOG1 [Penicillium oxalicum]|uniref:Mitogen-activated protein kinase HOG1 n=1 Tax=Penicillium oxalicum TaxID=69781 RepID=UPI0020B8A5E8|nr:Mitogen-activated protein kinase HOG1 [Penicillium oxalicum]KAI2792307.1 Mitogen-activated protein kinase HOG1 [Penicillium oxalicum]
MIMSMDHSPATSRGLAHFQKKEIMGTLFETTERYQQIQPVGMGVTGLVCSARDQIGHQTVAVKKLPEPFKTANVAKHMYREIKLLKNLQHENIIHLKDIFISPAEEIYLVTDLMATDLHTLLNTKKLDNQFTEYFLYQIMRGLKYVHSAGVVHRDLKPGNILVNENCDLKICDFGLARMQEKDMTGYVATRFYRAPEIMLTWRQYDEKVDIWSVGCIFAEMLTGKPLFPGKNHVDQFCVITQVLGSPPEHVVKNISSFNYDPQERISAAKALEAPYLASYHDPDDEPVAPLSFDWSVLEADLSVDSWKEIMYSEILGYHEQSAGNHGKTGDFYQMSGPYDGMDLS